MNFDSFYPLIQQSLCPNELGFTPDGYISTCFTNTYLYSPLALILSLWAVFETRSLNTNDHAPDTLVLRLKFLLTVGVSYLVLAVGPNTFNGISQLVSIFTSLIVFVLSFADMKGVKVPQKPLELYYLLIAAVTGYFVVHSIGIHQYDSGLRASVYLCLLSSIAGSARNIISAFEDAKSHAK